MSELPDGVIDAARLGEEWALTALYRQLHPALVRFLAVRARGEEEDLATDVWLDAARALPGFEGDADGFRRLLFTIARRRAIDHHRKRDRRRTEPADVEALVGAGDQTTPDVVVLDEIDAEGALARIRAVLPPDQAEIVILRVIVGLSVGEVAEVTGRRPGTVSVIQHRALRRLARHFTAPVREPADRGESR